jgi:predicted small secreted protein
MKKNTVFPKAAVRAAGLPAVLLAFALVLAGCDNAAGGGGGGDDDGDGNILPVELKNTIWERNTYTERFLKFYDTYIEEEYFAAGNWYKDTYTIIEIDGNSISAIEDGFYTWFFTWEISGDGDTLTWYYEGRGSNTEYYTRIPPAA